jgi:hypothetical protein
MTIINNQEATIDTVTPALTVGQIQLSADRRTTKETPLTDAERIRRVVLPVGHWGELSASTNGQPMQGLTDCLREALRSIGSARLRDTLAAAPMQRTVALADYTVAALLAWNAETAGSRGSITFTREQVEAWYPTSAIAAAMTAKSKEHYAFMLNRLACLAAKMHGIKEAAHADKLVTLLADDAGSSTGAELIQRLAHITKQLTEKKAEAISMDDL